jgi:acyl-CoA ligase (AMP-forming) (exosortase A-associated)
MTAVNERPYLLHHLLESSAALHPGKEAVVDGTHRLSYAGFRDVAASAAGVLRHNGLRRRDRVAIYLDRGFQEATAIFAVSMAGGVFVPINPLLKPSQIRYILADCDVGFLFTTSSRWSELRPLRNELPALRHVLLTDSAALAEDWVHCSVFEEPTQPRSPDEAIGEDLAAIMYTSGSTGRPKGVMLSHRNLLAGSRIVSKYLGLTEDDRILAVLPLSFDYGLNQLITAVEHSGTTVIFGFRFGDEIVQVLKSERITGLAGVPTIWAILTRAAPTLTRTELPHLRYLTNSGGAVPSRTVRRLRELLPQTQLFLMYGLTEAFRSTYLDPKEVDYRPTSVGRAIPECEVFLVEPATGKRCEPGEAGHLVHRGPTVAMGYWNRPEETAGVFRHNPMIREHEGNDIVCYSGDLMRTDAEGYLYFVARDDAMIKTTGYRISPTEVEEVLTQSASVREAAVIGLPDETVGERVHAVVVPVSSQHPDPDSLRKFCADNLPGYMVPREVEYAIELPRSPNGKVDYKSLRAAHG